MYAKVSYSADPNDLSAQGDWVNVFKVRDYDLSEGNGWQGRNCDTPRHEMTYSSEVFMMKMLSARSSEVYELSEIIFYDGNSNRIEPTTVFSGNDKQNSKEYLTHGALTLLDSNQDTYWQSLSEYNHIVFTFAKDVKPVTYHLASNPNDATRDPKSWKWWGREEGGDGGIAGHHSQDITSRHVTKRLYSYAHSDDGPITEPLICKNTRVKKTLHARRPYHTVRAVTRQCGSCGFQHRIPDSGRLCRRL